METYRDISMWGDKREPLLKPEMEKLMSEIFGIDVLNVYSNIGNEKLKLNKSCIISPDIIKAIQEISGAENVSNSDEERALHAYGKYYAELLQLRLGIVKNPPDIVVYPRTQAEIEQLVYLCHKNKIPIIPFGGGSSVTGALQAPKGGICIDLSRHIKKVLEINVINHTVRVEAGILGPELEKTLNDFKFGYTCGHFPQSFEFSTPGGWIAARGAGTFSTGYGKIEDIMLSLKVICPSGIIETIDYPADAEGINLNHIFLGSEGIFGIITEATLKIRPYQPKNIRYASFVFKSFESAVESMRETMQAGYGKPHLYRISDPTETEIAFKLKGFENTIYDKALKNLGYKPGQRTLMFAAIDGSESYPAFVKKRMKRTARKFKGLFIGGKPTKKWLEQRYSSAYDRDPLMDRNLITDTIETAVNWENLISLWQAIRSYLESRPKTLVMTHISHVYENGANLYVTYISPLATNNEIADYQNFHEGLVNTIIANKGSLSHHHGIGRVLSKWMAQQKGETAMEVLKSIKSALDPNHIMNPGGMLGMD